MNQVDGEEQGIYRIYDDTDAVNECETGYVEAQRHKVRCLLAVTGALVALVLLTVLINNSEHPMSEVLVALFTHETDSIVGRFVWNIDLPIIVAAIVVGAGLSVAGAVMQCILKNPLASPYTLGLSNAAAFGAAFSVIFFNSGAAVSGFLGSMVTPFVAFLFAMAATALILVLTRVTRISAETMVLAGIAVSAIFSAGLTLMQYIADPVQLGSIVSWMFGDLSYATWGWDAFLVVVLALACAFFYINRWNLNAVAAGDEVAKGLGIDTDALITVCMVVSALLSAVMVSKFGVIAFVGLLGPHMARLAVGGDHRFLIPLSVLFGAILLLVANVIGQNIALPMVLPVGMLTSLIGGPAFIYLLIRRYRR